MKPCFRRFLAFWPSQGRETFIARFPNGSSALAFALSLSGSILVTTGPTIPGFQALLEKYADDVEH